MLAHKQMPGVTLSDKEFELGHALPRAPRVAPLSVASAKLKTWDFGR